MDQEKSNVFVFDKKELALLVLFFIVMAVTSFVLGVRFGKHHTMGKVNIQEQDQQTVNLVSQKEEEIGKIVDEEAAVQQGLNDKGETEQSEGEVAGGGTEKSIDDQTFQKLKNEFEKLEAQDFKRKDQIEMNQGESDTSDLNEQIEQQIDEGVSDTSTRREDNDQLKPDQAIVGKYTIQVGSFKTLNEAQEFADAFLIRDYSPIINEVDIDGSGKWYRVSLGVFGSIRDAKTYVSQEKSLFNNQEYVITEIR